MQVGYVALPFAFIAMVVSFKNLQLTNYSSRFWCSWLLSFLVFAMFFVMRFGDHDYYIMSLLPWTAMIAAKGADLALDTRWRKMTLLLLLTVPIYGLGRIYGRWFDPKQRSVPTELLYGHQVQQGIPKSDLVLVSGDHSPITFLYYLKRKGISFSMLTADEYEQLLSIPFGWIIHYKLDGSFPTFLTEHYVLELKHETQQFSVFKIQSLR